MAKSFIYRELDDGSFEHVQTDHNNNDLETVVATYTAEEYAALWVRPVEDVERENRQMRDHKLSSTDWWCVSDRTPTQQQLDYRQALRDITTHANWPRLEQDDWPTNPEGDLL
jgi:hypothetical protein